MPSLSGLFDYFPELEVIPVDKIIGRLNRRDDSKLLTNELGNRILYPQLIPENESQLTLDWAILQSYLAMSPSRYYDKHLNRFYIHEMFLPRFLSLKQLVLTYIEVFHPQGIVTLVLRTENLGDKSLGTLLRPTVLGNQGTVDLVMKDKTYSIKPGTVLLIPNRQRRVDFRFQSNVAQLGGKNSLLAEVPGGEVGLIVDTRGG
ncbi:MAG: hypothetical protein Q7S44_03180 [bacterium]|nr:hypothetical protein [bacterium]